MRFGRGRVVPCGRAGCGGASVCSAWPASGLKCNGWLWARAACVILGCVGSESLSGCAGVVACVCGAPCMSAICAECRLGRVPEEFTSSVCAVARAAGAAAARWKPANFAETGRPVPPCAREGARSERRAKAAAGEGNVVRMLKIR